MKICLVNNLYAGFSRGGAEQVVGLIADELERRGHETFVVTLKPWGARTPKQEKRPTYFLGSGYGHLGRWPWALKLAWHAALFYNPVKFAQLRRILKKEKPDLILSHNLTGFGFGILALFKQCRHIHTAHDIQLLHPSGLMLYGQEGIIDSAAAKTYQNMIRKLIAPSSTVIFPSLWLEQLHLSHNLFSGNRRLVIENPVKGESTPEKKKSTGKAFKFLYVGQIEQHKGIELLIEAFGQTAIEAQLVVVGEGSLLERCKKNKDKRIEFRGRLPNDKVQELMQTSDCLVMPSLCYENLPTVILEARSNGLPVIASNLGGVPEMVDEDSLFEPTKKALIKALEKAAAGNIAVAPADFLVSVDEYVNQLLSA